jgi:hypothetical protein
MSKEPPKIRRTTHWNDRYALVPEVPPASRCGRIDGQTIADTLDKNHRIPNGRQRAGLELRQQPPGHNADGLAARLPPLVPTLR